MALTQIVNDGLGASLTATSEGGAVTTSIQQGVAKAWASINQDSTGHPVYDSFNVSSTADSSTGETTVTYSTNTNNADYALSGTAQSENEGGACFTIIGKYVTFPNTTSTFRSDNRSSAGSMTDCQYFSFSLHGDLA